MAICAQIYANSLCDERALLGQRTVIVSNTPRLLPLDRINDFLFSSCFTSTLSLRTALPTLGLILSFQLGYTLCGLRFCLYFWGGGIDCRHSIYRRDSAFNVMIKDVALLFWNWCLMDLRGTAASTAAPTGREQRLSGQGWIKVPPWHSQRILEANRGGWDSLCHTPSEEKKLLAARGGFFLVRGRRR